MTESDRFYYPQLGVFMDMPKGAFFGLDFASASQCQHQKLHPDQHCMLLACQECAVDVCQEFDSAYARTHDLTQYIQ